MSLKNPQHCFNLILHNIFHILKIQEHALQIFSARPLCESSFSFQNLPQKEKLSTMHYKVSAACFLILRRSGNRRNKCLLNTLTEIFPGCIVSLYPHSRLENLSRLMPKLTAVRINNVPHKAQ